MYTIDNQLNLSFHFQFELSGGLIIPYENNLWYLLRINFPLYCRNAYLYVNNCTILYNIIGIYVCVCVCVLIHVDYYLVSPQCYILCDLPPPPKHTHNTTQFNIIYKCCPFLLNLFAHICHFNWIIEHQCTAPIHNKDWETTEE